jgi:hypothetical protein
VWLEGLLSRNAQAGSWPLFQVRQKPLVARRQAFLNYQYLDNDAFCMLKRANAETPDQRIFQASNHTSLPFPPENHALLWLLSELPLFELCCGLWPAEK